MTLSSRKKAITWIILASLVVSLMAAVSPAFAALSGELKLSGSTTVQPLAQELAKAFMKKNKSVSISVSAGGSGVGIKDVAAGRVNIGMSSRDLKDEELADGLVPNAIARDAIVIIINKGNSVKKLSKDQVRKIFAGEITNWKDVGGKNAPIIVNGRTAPSGTLDFFMEKFMGDSKLGSNVKQQASNGLVRQAVKSNKNAIGFVSMAYMGGCKGLAIDGKVPNMGNAKSGKYPYVRNLYFVTKGKAKGLAKAFIDFAKSGAGQAIAKKEYIGIK